MIFLFQFSCVLYYNVRIDAIFHLYYMQKYPSFAMPSWLYDNYYIA